MEEVTDVGDVSHLSDNGNQPAMNVWLYIC
jgi:hypothetical protein